MNVKTVAAVALVCGSLAFLDGCAMMSSKGDSSAMAGKPTTPAVASSYVTQVNTIADQQGAKVALLSSADKPAHD
jgi:hypothetical protein